MGVRVMLAALGVIVPALLGCSFDRSGLGRWAPEAGPADAARTDGGYLDGTSADAVDAPYDASGDAGPADAALPPEAGLDAQADTAIDTAQSDSAPPCSGAVVGGYCWYASAADQSCTAACATHGGCNLTGTRDFAGSGGTDANCVSVLDALGYGAYRHQNWCNNDLGCQFAWPGDPWTYWSQALATTCEAVHPGDAHAVRMCACNE